MSMPCCTAADLSVRKPRIRFQGYWELIKEDPLGPAGTEHCSYFIDWFNESINNFRCHIENPELPFQDLGLLWNNSTSQKLLISELEVFAKSTKITKLICFGLGNLCLQHPEWTKKHNELEMDCYMRCSMTQHSVALTLVELFGKYNDNIELLAQDPEYTRETADFLEGKGFKIVGEFGAGGFAEVDDESVVFSPFVTAPARQIIADIARPAAYITDKMKVYTQCL